MDGKKLVKQAQDNKEVQEDLTLDIVFIQQGHVEYCRYLKQHKAGQKGHFQAIAICGPGRMFAVRSSSCTSLLSCACPLCCPLLVVSLMGYVVFSLTAGTGR